MLSRNSSWRVEPLIKSSHSHASPEPLIKRSRVFATSCFDRLRGALDAKTLPNIASTATARKRGEARTKYAEEASFPISEFWLHGGGQRTMAFTRLCIVA